MQRRSLQIMVWLILGLPGGLIAQSLIPNGSFEQYRNCPRTDNVLREAVPWYNPNLATPDFYHQCFQTGQMPLPPRTGQGLARLFFDRGWAEYLAVPLTKPLVAKECYYFEMYVAVETPNKYITQTLGAYFSSQPVLGTTTDLLTARPQVLDTQLKTSDPRLEWEKVGGFITASGGEKFVTIGSFYKLPPFLGFYYLYFDDITLLPVQLDLGKDTTLCGRKSTYTLNATTPGASDYLWSDGSNRPTLKVTKPGTYSVKVTTNCKILTDTITVNYALDFGLGADTTLCNGQSLVLSVPANAASSYQWQDGSLKNSFTVNKAGQYSVRVKQAGCLAADTIQIRYIQPPELTLGPDKELCGTDVFVIKPVVAQGQFAWQDDFSEVDRTVSSSGVYRASVRNACATVVDSIVVDYGACGCELYTPNAFTPNGDGVNDVFTTTGCGDITLASLSVFSRWGELLFYTATPPFVWDGAYHGQPCQEDMYTWKTQFWLKQGKKVVFKQQQGPLQLIR